MLLMVISNPAYVRLLWTDPIGVKLMWYAFGVAMFGVLWMRKLIRIRV
jgi:tight adherence protein B